MTNERARANTPALSEMQHEANVLACLIEGIDLMDNAGKEFDNARSALTQVALKEAKALADDLDKLEGTA